jgi:diaminohydroxyphosphoribosylaminopyrimidine deaminase/5-amino-6-(5-phosphoribosylamino)uracil reductase
VGRNPVRIVIDPDLRSPVNSNVFNTEAGTIVFYRTNKLKAKLEVLRKKGIVLIKMGANDSFKYMIKQLSKMHIYKVLIEGGGETSGRAFDDGVVDEVAFFVAPKIVGGRHSITPVEGAGIARIVDAIKLGPLSIKRFGRDILISARVVK